MTDVEKVRQIWLKKGKPKGLIVPQILLAYDKNMQDYFVYKDSSTILYLYLDKTNAVFVIPKEKYTRIETDERGNQRYRILDSFKLINITCTKKDKYQLFVEEYLVS